jgi:hypothetical protein
MRWFDDVDRTVHGPLDGSAEPGARERARKRQRGRL